MFLTVEGYKSEARVSYHSNKTRSFKSSTLEKDVEKVMFEDNTQHRHLTVNFIRFLKRIIDDSGSVE